MIKLAILTPKNSSEKIKNSLKEITCEIKYIFYNNFLTYPLYATYWVLYRKIIFKLTDKKENYNILKSYIRALITVIIISIPILIITICNFYMHFFQYNYFYIIKFNTSFNSYEY